MSAYEIALRHFGWAATRWIHTKIVGIEERSRTCMDNDMGCSNWQYGSTPDSFSYDKVDYTTATIPSSGIHAVFADNAAWWGLQPDNHVVVGLGSDVAIDSAGTKKRFELQCNSTVATDPYAPLQFNQCNLVLDGKTLFMMGDQVEFTGSIGAHCEVAVISYKLGSSERQLAISARY